MKRKLSLALAAVMLFTGIYTTGVSAEKADETVAADTTLSMPTASDEQTYDEYISNAGDFSPATGSVKVNAVDFVSSNGAKLEKLESFEGKSGVLKWTGEEGTVLYEVNVPATGLYNIKFDYYCLPNKNNPISLGLKIDGKVLFEGMEEFDLPRVFEDDGDVRVDGIGNEFAAAQKEVYMFQTGYFKDATGLEPKPYQIALTAGKHTIEVESVAEPFALNEIIFEAPVEYDDYATVSEDYDTDKYATITEPIILEGEDAAYKSTHSLVGQYDQTDPSVSSKNPASPYLTRINYIGGSNWQSPGSKLTWKFTVPESGYYKIGFRYKQNLVLGGDSYRKLTVDGVQPFSEAANIKFGYDLDWMFQEFADEEGNAFLIYLEADVEHEIALEVSLGDLTDSIRALKNVMYDVGLLYRQIVSITGESPDYNRDYALYDQIPNFIENLTAYRDELNRIADEIETIAGKGGSSNAATIRTMSNSLNNMIEFKYYAHQYKSDYYTNYTSVSALVYSMMDMGLSLDYITVAAPDYEYEDVSAGFFESLSFGFQRFLASFSADYNNISGDVEAEEEISIWVNWGRDQIRVLNNLIESSFTEETGIGVNLKMSNATYVQAILSGKGPDCSLNMARSEPVNLALRGAMVDLKKFNYYDSSTKSYTEEYTGDYDKVIKRFISADAVTPYSFQDGVYALPDTTTFYMMFYRTDIFEEYDLKVPTTWDEFIEVSSILYRNNLQASLPYTQITTVAQVNTGVGALSIYPTLIMQMGGQVYKADETATDLTSPTSIKAFEFWTDFYTEYKFPVTADFFNRFRVGTMPLGIQTYSTYINFSMAAPEITGKWKMVPIPGFENEDGTINNAQAGGGTGCGILRTSENPEAGWEFLKWWTSADTQLEYSNNCESILGVSGRVATSNVEALTRMGWDKDSVESLVAQWKNLKEVPEIPGSYYTSRCIDQAYWNVVNNSKNAKDMLIKWAEVADNEIQRKREQYNVQ